ncbi:hypothetical protein SAMN05660642_00801 [Geodermatophilus siccatus]|uniref:SPW repeat-containing protein n=1 Tax=Geodermatophilus siccatus TaxID=1137991 RepID=A0A1G9MWG2_9ACTN|nr:hypothetical protein [Geodermatophilus siccatus]SDL78463.1 hypothetical protein SAMN05660642_00801 [Geodermatophilus siccatus]
MTTTVRPVPSLLRLALRLDAAVTAANGAAYLLAAPLLGDLLGLPAGWLRGVGVFLLLIGAVVCAVAARPTPPAVGTVVAANVLWAVGSLVVAGTGVGGPTAVGAAWTVLQAVVVAAFAGLQVAGLRRS